ncbi:MAG TPA: hypothetical protein VF181_03175 [Balneolaceae bacterium]
MENLNLKRCNVEKLTEKSQRGISGGVYWWIPVALTVAYTEINDIWESGGQNLVDAYESGQDFARGI